MSVLTLEIWLTRIFSVSLWYHLAFMIVSTALLGFGASGTLLVIQPSLFHGDVRGRLGLWAALFSLGVVVSFGLMVRIPLDPLAIVDVMYEPNPGGLAWGLSCTYSRYTPEEKFITIDGTAITTISRWTGDLEEVRYLNYTPASLAYQLHPSRHALTIGSGGGVDVLTALYNGARQITGVEINLLIVEPVAGPYREFSGDLYSDVAQVDLQVAEGRSFASRSQEQCDIIQFSQADTWAAASSGAHSLTENYLYTLEAFDAYIDHLAPDGILTVGHWYFEPPQQALRL